MNTVKAALSYWTRSFKRNQIPEPDWSAKYIISHAIGEKQVLNKYTANFTKVLTEIQMNRIKELCEKRLQRMPVQYILGEWDFRNLTLSMKPPVFIPRPETEELVGFILKFHSKKPQIHFLEVGCGSGAISLSLLDELPQSTGVAIDQSIEAVELTTLNAKRLGVFDRLSIHRCELTDTNSVPDSISGSYDVIVSNPPYIFKEDMQELAPEVIRYEDHRALEGGNDGLEVTQRIIELARQLLKPKGSIWLEGDLRHPAMIQAWLTDNPHTQIKLVNVHKDFTNRPRFCHLRYIPYKE
ncbi:MTRF1L release factor glutamine methyltransferase-like [Glandiceps talaboti]